MSRFRALLGIVFFLAARAAYAAEAPGEILRLPVRHGEQAAMPLGSALEGARAVVSLWATYCPPCRVEVPALRQMARRWGAAGVRVIGVAVDVDDPRDVARIAREWGIDYDTYWVPGDAWARVAALVPDGLPVTFFVGPTGVSRYDRVLTEADVDTLVPERLGLERPSK